MKPGPVFTVVIALSAMLLAACQDADLDAKPGPVALTEEAAGHYCQMIVLDHPGPKAQVHIAGNPHPLWFTQVRDAVAFAQSPEERNTIAAIYVNDMTDAEWDAPAAATWIPAESAHFVIESRRAGGMGAPEAVPFGDRSAADRFAAEQGGRIVGFADIPREYVLSPVDISNVLQGVGG